MKITTCVFDAYGTLFDVAAAARLAAKEAPDSPFAQHWPKLAEIWRAKQLQYTWLRAITGAHTNFWEVTQNGLDFALEALKLDQDDALRARLLQLYWELQAYPEVPQMLKDLKSVGVNTAILSNGSPNMLNGAVQSAGLEDYLDAVLSVESTGIFKPDSTVYDLVALHMCNISLYNMNLARFHKRLLQSQLTTSRLELFWKHSRSSTRSFHVEYMDSNQS